jgi:flagellar basal-body rod modification protein FlgD
MDASLFSKVQAAQAAAAHAVGTSLAPKGGATSNLKSAIGATPATAATKRAAAATTGSTTGTSNSAASATAAGATITSSDFLTLLVSELQNQDPTQPTDPNEYISQLVEVNSLEQLIAINSGITSLDTAAGATVSGSTNALPTGSAVPAGSVPLATASAPPQHTRPTSGAV